MNGFRLNGLGQLEKRLGGQEGGRPWFAEHDDISQLGRFRNVQQHGVRLTAKRRHGIQQAFDEVDLLGNLARRDHRHEVAVLDDIAEFMRAIAGIHGYRDRAAQRDRKKVLDELEARWQK